MIPQYTQVQPTAQYSNNEIIYRQHQIRYYCISQLYSKEYPPLISQPTNVQPTVQYSLEDNLQYTTQQEYNIQTTSPVFAVTEKLIAHIRIPDRVEFEHKFKITKPYCSGNEVVSSEFSIPGLGEFLFCLETDLCCGCQCKCNCDCDAHYYPDKVYGIKNQAIEMQYKKQGVGKISVGSHPIIDFNQTHPNDCDRFCAHWCSSHPKILISYPFEPNHYIILRPDTNCIPETCMVPPCCCLGMLQGLKCSRSFFVDGLKQGSCEIENSRGFYHACGKCGGFQSRKCCFVQCPDSDYPNFTVQFQGVRQLDKIAIIMSLMHHSIYQEWCGNQRSEDPRIVSKLVL